MGLAFTSYEFSQCHLIQMLNKMPNQIQIYQVIQHLIQPSQAKNVLNDSRLCFSYDTIKIVGEAREGFCMRRIYFIYSILFSSTV